MLSVVNCIVTISFGVYLVVCLFELVLFCACVCMCGCFDNCVGVLVICVLAFIVFFVLFVLCYFMFRLYLFILISSVCTSVRTTATE